MLRAAFDPVSTPLYSKETEPQSEAEAVARFVATKAQSGHLEAKRDISRAPGPASVRSASWTGRTNIVDAAQRVLELAPVAVSGLEALIHEHERRAHNLPPETTDHKWLQALRLLHEEIGALLLLAQRDASAVKKSSIANIYKRAAPLLALGRRAGELTAGGTLLSVASYVPAFAAVKAIELMCGKPLDGGAVATVYGGAVAALGAAEAIRTLKGKP